LDLLDVRLWELRDVVGKIFLIESNRTTAGLPKPYHFAAERYDKFSFFTNRIVYKQITGPDMSHAPGSDAAQWTAHLHDTLTALIDTRAPNTHAPPLVIASALEEIPSQHTLRLLRMCAFPTPAIGLQMRDYLYSFEWPAPPEVASVHVGGEEGAQVFVWERARTRYSREMSAEVVLADSGWRCNFCYRKIAEFVQKSKEVHILDRHSFDPSSSSFSRKRIHEALCSGKDIFGAFPGTSSYRGMFQPTNMIPSKSMVGIPRGVIESADDYAYMLPGGCRREDADPHIRI